MYALKDYPFVVPTGKPDDQITVEVVRVSSWDEIRRLCDFEFSVGYELMEVQAGEWLTGIFIFSEQAAASHALPEKRVINGDWVRFVKSSQPH